MNPSASNASSQSPGLTPEKLLQHWQGHRRLTRRTIEAFPSDELFSFSIAGMRTFGAMAMEVVGMAVPVVQGVISGVWATKSDHAVEAKEDVLRRWDESTHQIDALWPQIPPERFEATLKASQWEMPVYDAILYAIDNEIHHRAQGYVYLRALGVEPPPFHAR